MRRIFSILFVILFGLAPLAATLAGDNASLPACCRRHGAHQCAMADDAIARIFQVASRPPSFTPPSHCPQYPERGNAAPSPAPALPQIARAVSTETHSLLPLAASTLAAGSIHLRLPALRGPPASAR